MSVVQLHPEGLLERAAEGELNDTESATLGAHLAQCTACRVLQAARLDFEQERHSWPDNSKRALVHGALSKLHNNREADVTAPAPPPRSMRRRRAAVGALALFLVGTSAAAGIAVWQQAKLASQPPASQSVDEPVVDTQPVNPHPVSTQPVSTSESPQPVESAAIPVVDTPEAPPSAPPSPTTAPKVGADAASLFAQASTVRNSGDASGALALFRKLQRQFPSSAEAKTARVILARLLLDVGATDEALSTYQDHLDSGDEQLIEEALLGRALAHQRLDQADKERSAWHALLARYPDTIHKARAEARLAALRL